MKATRRAVQMLAGAALAAGLCAVPQTALAQENPYERGPDPTERSIEASLGSYDVAEDSVSGLFVNGFGGGTVYYPEDTDETFGAVAISPGFTAYQSSIAWLGPRLASRGFVVMTIDTNTTLDQPASRGDQLLAALDYLVEDSEAADLIDPSRLGVMGHSMGGGGTLEASLDRPSLQAAIPLTGWNLRKDFSDSQVPTLVVGAENDSIASVTSHSEPFYESLPPEKAYVELAGASHFAPNTANTDIAKYSIAWLKRYIDNDTRYTQFICPGPDTGLFSDISEYRSTCPM